MALIALGFVLICVDGSINSNKPNIVFLMGESVASSGYFFNGNPSPMPLPNIEFLKENGISFPHTYAASPVCNPSRATTLTGRHAHYLGHYQTNPDTGLYVNGTWNNHEGINTDYQYLLFDIMKNYGGYNTKHFGKTDWNSGAHTLSCRVTAWCNKVNFPYIVSNTSYGWYDEKGAGTTGLKNGNATWYSTDWNNVNSFANWIKDRANDNEPFFGYWGSYIVHPPYNTNQYWLSKVNMSMVDAPYWIQRDSMHPEDYQSSMKKYMFGPCCDDDEKKKVRSYYYATIAEYDSMIGEIIDAVRDSGQLNNTWIIATSDHGDMKYEHAQFYKMVFYDSSSRVPSIIYAGDKFDIKRNVINTTQINSLLDYFPTILDIASVNKSNITGLPELNGYSLMNSVLTKPDKQFDNSKPNYVMSQFHGDEIHLSWFLLRYNEYKYVVYGSGNEVPSRLFNIIDDPYEMNDLALNYSYHNLMNEMDQILRTIIDYPAIAQNVEEYNKDSYVLWRNSFTNETLFNETVSQDIRWSDSWSYDSDGSFNAIDEWLQTPNNTFHWAFKYIDPSNYVNLSA